MRVKNVLNWYLSPDEIDLVSLMNICGTEFTDPVYDKVKLIKFTDIVYKKVKLIKFTYIVYKKGKINKIH